VGLKVWEFDFRYSDHCRFLIELWAWPPFALPNPGSFIFDTPYTYSYNPSVSLSHPKKKFGKRYLESSVYFWDHLWGIRWSINPDHSQDDRTSFSSAGCECELLIGQLAMNEAVGMSTCVWSCFLGAKWMNECWLFWCFFCLWDKVWGLIRKL